MPTDRYVVVLQRDDGTIAGVLGAWVLDTAKQIAEQVCEFAPAVVPLVIRAVPLRELSETAGVRLRAGPSPPAGPRHRR